MKIFKKASRPSTYRPQFEALEDRQVPAVLNYGGSVLHNVQTQALYLGNAWLSQPATAPQPATLDAFLADVTGGAYMDALSGAGYGVGRGTDVKGVVDTRPLATNAMVADAAIQQTIKADIASGLLQAPNANTLYVVYVSPNVAVNLGAGQGTTQQGVLGYHGAFAGAGGQAIRYAVVAYPGGSIHNSSLGTSSQDQLTSVTSHELAEAVTDPDVNFGRLGWYDPRRGEIGDITENNPNALVRLDGYLVQEAADQNDRLLSLTTTTPPVTPPAPPALVATTTAMSAGKIVRRRYVPPTVTLTVTVAAATGSILPNGMVELLYNGRILATGTVHIVNGVSMVAFNVEFLGHGTYTFSTEYLGSTNFTGSSSAPLVITV